MDRMKPETFQDYHESPATNAPNAPHHSLRNSPSQKMDCMEHGPEDDEASLSGSCHHSSGPDEAVFEMPSQHSSPRTSHGSSDDLLSSPSPSQQNHQSSSPFIPLKKRSPFRNPSSVRAMQTDITPPHMNSPSSSLKRQRPKLPSTPSRQTTPRSTTRRSYNTPIRPSASKISPNKPLKKEHPLILLHVTLLPSLPMHFSPQLLETVLPPTILANWKLLHERFTSTVLERGILIPHPKEDYDLLEERLLESMELKQPRILKCGHFQLSPEEAEDVEGRFSEDEDDELEFSSAGEDADICQDCGRRIRDGRYGDAGRGDRRWDIKIFAANGLMRAGAWGAAWREMERVDVEVLPWMEERVKRELELRREQQQEEEQEQTRLKERARHAGAREDEGVGGLDDERLREIYGQNAQDYVDGLMDEDNEPLPVPQTPEKEAPGGAAQQRSTTSPPPPSEYRRQHSEEVPLQDLLRNYLSHAAKDRRNIIIFLLSVLVLFLATTRASPRTGRTATTTTMSPSQIVENHDPLLPPPPPTPTMTNAASSANEELLSTTVSTSGERSAAGAATSFAIPSSLSLGINQRHREETEQSQAEDDDDDDGYVDIEQQILSESAEDIIGEMSSE